MVGDYLESSLITGEDERKIRQLAQARERGFSTASAGSLGKPRADANDGIDSHRPDRGDLLGRTMQCDPVASEAPRCSCGVVLAEGSTFCRKCGYRREQACSPHFRSAAAPSTQAFLGATEAIATIDTRPTLLAPATSGPSLKAGSLLASYTSAATKASREPPPAYRPMAWDSGKPARNPDKPAVAPNVAPEVGTGTAPSSGGMMSFADVLRKQEEISNAVASFIRSTPVAESSLPPPTRLPHSSSTPVMRPHRASAPPVAGSGVRPLSPGTRSPSPGFLTPVGFDANRSRIAGHLIMPSMLANGATTPSLPSFSIASNTTTEVVGGELARCALGSTRQMGSRAPSLDGRGNWDIGSLATAASPSGSGQWPRISSDGASASTSSPSHRRLCTSAVPAGVAQHLPLTTTYGFISPRRAIASSSTAFAPQSLARPSPASPRNTSPACVSGDVRTRSTSPRHTAVSAVAEIGARVEAEYQSTWYTGTVRQLPADSKDGKYSVQCDADKEGMLTPTVSVRLPCGTIHPSVAPSPASPARVRSRSPIVGSAPFMQPQLRAGSPRSGGVSPAVLYQSTGSHRSVSPRGTGSQRIASPRISSPVRADWTVTQTLANQPRSVLTRPAAARAISPAATLHRRETSPAPRGASASATVFTPSPRRSLMTAHAHTAPPYFKSDGLKVSTPPSAARVLGVTAPYAQSQRPVSTPPVPWGSFPACAASSTQPGAQTYLGIDRPTASSAPNENSGDDLLASLAQVRQALSATASMAGNMPSRNAPGVVDRLTSVGTSVAISSLPETPQPGSMRVTYGSNIQVASPAVSAPRVVMLPSVLEAMNKHESAEAISSSAQKALAALGSQPPFAPATGATASGMLTPRFSQEVGRDQDGDEAELEREIAEAANATEAAHARLRDALAKLQSRRQ